MKKFLIIILSLFISINYIYATDESSDIAKYYFKQAVKMDIAGNYTEAIKNYDKVISFDSTNAIAYNNRAIAKYNVAPYIKGSTCNFFGCSPTVDMQYCDDVIKDLDTAIKLNKNFAEAYYNRGLVKAYKFDRYSAIKDYSKAIKLNPKDDKPYAERSYLYMKVPRIHIFGFYYNFLLFQDTHKNALKDINEAIELSSNNADYYVKKSFIYKFEDMYDKELQCLDKAITIDSNNGETYILRAKAKENLKYSVDSILADYNKAIEINNNNSDFYSMREYYKERIGDIKGAEEDHIKSKEVYWKNKEDYYTHQDIAKKINPETFSIIY